MKDLISRQAALDALKDMYQAAEKWGQEASDYIVKARTELCMVSLIEMKMRIEKLPSAQQEQRWIPVSERLPEEPYGCLVTVWDTEPMTGAEFENILPYFVGWDGEQWNDGEGEQCPFEVIAWLPLPTVYRKEQP